jgi:hypothetical protein
MRKSKRHQLRSLRFRLFIVVAVALMLAGAFVPRTHATPIVYWNFDDGVIVGGQVNLTSDAPGAVITNLIPFGVNPYGAPPDMRNDSPGLDLGSISGPSVFGMGLARSGQHTPAEFRFNLFTSQGFFQNMTLQFAINSGGNGFTGVAVAFSTNGGGSFTPFGTGTILTGPGQLFTFVVPTAANNAPLLTFSIILTGGQSNGIDLQNVVDNILIDGTIVPEPTTIAGGLLGVLALCWHQRRRLIGALRLRRT